MIGAFQFGFQEGVDTGVGLTRSTRSKLGAAKGRKGSLGENLAGQADAGAHFLPVIGMCHVIELHPRQVFGGGAAQFHPAPAFRPLGADMDLKAVAAGHRLAVIGYRQRQKVKLDVGVDDPGAATDMATGFEMVGCPQPLARQQPPRAKQGFSDRTHVRIKRDRLTAFHLQIDLHVIHQIAADLPAICDHRDPMPG